MILTCPNCATRYVVGDDAVPAGGRTVRCASCGERWRALPEGDAPLELAPAPSAPAGFGRPTTEAPVSTAFRQQVQQRRRTREAMTAGMVFAAASAAALLLVLALALFPVQVVRVFPHMAGVYAALGRPVNPTGLALEAQGESGLAAGRPVLVIHGTERNVEARPRAATPLRVTLLDRNGRAVAAQLAPVAPGPIAPGEALAFRAVFTEPPLSATGFGVELAFDLPPPRAASPPHAAAPPRPAPAAPVGEARPLPAGSPYALPPAAAGGPHG